MDLISRKSLAVFAIAGGLFFANSSCMLEDLTWEKIKQNPQWTTLDILDWNWAATRPITDKCHIIEAIHKKMCTLYEETYRQAKPAQQQNLESRAISLSKNLIKAFGQEIMLKQKLEYTLIQRIKSISYPVNEDSDDNAHPLQGLDNGSIGKR